MIELWRPQVTRASACQNYEKKEKQERQRNLWIQGEQLHRTISPFSCARLFEAWRAHCYWFREWSVWPQTTGITSHVSIEDRDINWRLELAAFQHRDASFVFHFSNVGDVMWSTLKLQNIKAVKFIWILWTVEYYFIAMKRSTNPSSSSTSTISQKKVNPIFHPI